MVLLLGCLEDRHKVLERGPEGGLCLPAVLHEEIDLTWTPVRPRQPLSSLQQLREPQHGHLALGDADELHEFLWHN